MKARYRYRIYPDSAQQLLLSKLFGCIRVVWNDALAHCKTEYLDGNKKPSCADLQKLFITQAKKKQERAWLSEVSNIPLQQSLNDLEQAYQNFFKSCKKERKGKPVKPPKFKKRRSAQSARFRKGGFKICPRGVYLAKIGQVEVVWSRELPSEPSSVTVIKDAAGRYFASFVLEIQPSALPPLDNAVGVDLGISTFATLSTGEKVDAPKPLKKRIRRLRRLNKNLSRRNKGSNRYEVARRRKAKLQAKLKDTRTDFLHKLSTRLIRENQAIILEDLNVSGMLRNRKLSSSISDLGWRQFRTFLEGKADKYGREFRIINRWQPTSQTCSSCGFRGGKLDLSIREWICLSCETTHDRDINAALNIKAAGGHQEAQNGRGGKHQTTTKVAASREASTRQQFIQLSLFE